LAACSDAQKTIGPCPLSFTNALIQVLQGKTRETFSAKQIREEIAVTMEANRQSPYTHADDKLLIHSPVLQHFSGRDDIKLKIP
jgi:hypothetical protein